MLPVFSPGIFSRSGSSRVGAFMRCDDPCDGVACKLGEQQGGRLLVTMPYPLPRSRDSGRGIGPEGENVGRQGERRKSERPESPTACGPTV